jgi:hypothetical protein
MGSWDQAGIVEAGPHVGTASGNAPRQPAQSWCTLAPTVMRKTVFVSDLMPYLLRFSQQASFEIPQIVS